MEAFTTLISTCVPLPVENIDTDQIIPARFLKTTSRDGMGENLFRDWRYDDHNNEQQEFILNNPDYTGKILVAGHNFGCGSSREHAAWALYDYGFRAVVSSFFADIFKNNALNNGLLPIQVSPEKLDYILKCIEENPQQLMKVDLENELISLKERIWEEKFKISAYKKYCLINGLDDIDFLLDKREMISNYETSRSYQTI